MMIERRKRLLKLLAEQKSATVHELVELLESSPSTIRRDIGWLAARKLLTRRRGMAETVQEQGIPNSHPNATFHNNFLRNAQQKRAIARRAAAMCASGETIIINGGTTTFMMAEFLSEKNLTILTNSFLTAERLLASSQSDVVLTGGKVYREQNVILSPFENDVTEHHYASKMFMSVFGLSLLGLIESDPLLIQAEKRLINQAEKLVVLVDSSKFTRRAGLILCGLRQVHTVITDTHVSDAAVQWLEQSGIQVVTVEPEPLPRHSDDPLVNMLVERGARAQL
jgi:DeoR family ulaG and ulaABCDEF operon transcriptional repressor